MSMYGKHLREAVEIVGIVSIVASLLLVAWEVRQSNRIATTDVVLRLHEQFNNVHAMRLTSPEFAKLYPKIAAPGSHLVTATENSQMEGLAWHYVNIWISAQVAYDQGLVNRQQFERYRNGAASLVRRYPGLHPHLVNVSAAIPAAPTMEILRPVIELATQSQADSPENQ